MTPIESCIIGGGVVIWGGGGGREWGYGGRGSGDMGGRGSADIYVFPEKQENNNYFIIILKILSYHSRWLTSATRLHGHVRLYGISSFGRMSM